MGCAPSRGALLTLCRPPHNCLPWRTLWCRQTLWIFFHVQVHSQFWHQQMRHSMPYHHSTPTNCDQCWSTMSSVVLLPKIRINMMAFSKTRFSILSCLESIGMCTQANLL